MLSTFNTARFLKATRVIISLPKMHKSSRLKMLRSKQFVLTSCSQSSKCSWMGSLMASRKSYNSLSLHQQQMSIRHFSTSEKDSQVEQKQGDFVNSKKQSDDAEADRSTGSEIKPSEDTFIEFTKEDPGLQKRIKGIELPEAKIEEVDEDLELEKTERGRIVRERRVFLSEYKHFVYEQKWGAFMIFTGICFFVLGTWSLMVPLYKVVCEGFGFSTKSHKSDYNIDVTQTDVLRKWIVNFKAGIQDDIPWKFDAETKILVVGAGETALAFYKAYNSSDKPIVGLSIYQVDPNDASLYFNKVQ